MPQIFELFGHPLSVQTPEAQTCRRKALCPFMGGKCDGGGNRELSNIDLRQNPALQNYFENQTVIASGICSIQLKEGENPWIVCPRRLLVLGRKNAPIRAYQTQVEAEVLRLLGYPSGTQLGVWSEVKLKFTEFVEGVQKSFDYTFDYIVMPIGRVSQSQLEEQLGIDWVKWRRAFERGGYTLIRQGVEDFVEDCPYGIPSIVEIMTCSTSGGNKAKRTTIPTAFEDAILGRSHIAPVINKRQVWARMVSQLIVKSEVAIGWGGTAVWLIQDTLADYISTSTALDLHRFNSLHTSEVNMLSFSYGEQYKAPEGVIELRDAQLFAGPISSGSKNAGPSFQDMIRTPIQPSLKRLLARMVKSRPLYQIQT